MEENHDTSAGYFSKSEEQFIQIDSISIDLVSTDNESELGNCEHFSIRGFVSEIRKKDWKKCCPFTLDDFDRSAEPTSLFPPLEVPHFRWWKCQNCQKGLSTKGYKKAPQPDAILGGTSVAKTSIIKSNNSCPSSCSVENRKKTEIADSNRGTENRDMPKSSSVASEVKSCLILEKNKNYRGKPISPDNQRPELTCQASNALVVVDGEHNVVRCNGAHSPELDDSSFPSSKNAEISIGFDIQDHLLAKSSGFHRRKPPKVRLLTELLGENGDVKINEAETLETPCNRTPVSSTLDIPSVASCQVADRGNGRSLVQNKKRKLPLDEEWRPQEVFCSYDISGNGPIMRGGAETPVYSLITESETEVEETGVPMIKSHWSECQLDGNPNFSKNKNKRTEVVDTCFSFQQSRDDVPQEIPKIGEVSSFRAPDNVSPRTVAYLGKGIDSLSLQSSRIESNSNMSKKKSKMPITDEGHKSQLHWNNSTVGRGSNGWKDIEFIKSGPDVRLQEESSERGLHLSLSSYFASQRFDSKYIPRAEDQVTCLLPCQGSTSRLSSDLRKEFETYNVTDSNLCFKPPDAFCGYPCRTTLVNEKQNFMSPVEDRDWPRYQPLDVSGVGKVGIAIEGPENLAVKKKHVSQTVDKGSDQGACDDIPMEIVELMARNQYERCLHDAENSKNLSGKNSCTRIFQRTDLNGVHGNGNLRLNHEQRGHKKKSQGRNGINSTMTSEKNVRLYNQKPIDFFSQIGSHFNVNGLPTANNPKGYSAFVQSQTNALNGVQFSAICSGGRGSDMEGQRSSHSGIQVFGSCSKDLSLSCDNREAAHIWSKRTRNHLPYGFNMSDKSAAQSTKTDATLHRPGPPHKRTTADYTFGGYSNGIELRQNLMGPLDLSSETIPAMHLLSLMDAGMHSNVPIPTGGTPKCPVKSSFTQNVKAKGVSKRDISSYKTFNGISDPSSDCCSNNLSNKPHEFFLAAPEVTATTSFRHSEGSERVKNFNDLVSLDSGQKGKTICLDSAAWKRGQSAQKCVLASGGGLGTNNGAFPVHSVQRSLVGECNSMVVTGGYYSVENPPPGRLEYHGNNRASPHVKSRSCSEICSVNRNPADFSIPEAGNKYMIGAEDLKFAKRIPSQKHPGHINFDGRKRQRNIKRITEKGHAK